MAMTDSARLAMLALPHYVRKQMEPPTRKSYLLREIKTRGRETYLNGGSDIRWRPEKRRSDLTWGPGNPNVVTFPQENRWTAAQLDYKTAWMGASLSEIEMLSLADSDSRYFKHIKGVLDRKLEDFPIRFAPHLFGDGVGTEKIEGLKSFSGTSAAATYEPIGLPSDTYAGLSTVLGADGSDWSAPSGCGWPRCGSDPDSCDYEYSHWSPIIVNYNDAELRQDTTNESAGWDDCWIYACRYMMTYAGILTSSAPDVIILDPDLLRRAGDSLKTDQQFQLDPDSKGLDAGVKVLQFDGIKFATEFGCPPGYGFGIKFSELELMMMGKDFIKVDEDKDIVTGDKLYRLSWHGQLKCSSPVHFPMLKAVTSLGT